MKSFSEVAFVHCLTPGCGGRPMGITPAQARALIEYHLRDDPSFQLKFVCDRCGMESRYSLAAIVGMIPAAVRPRPLADSQFWAILLHELETAPEMAERAFLGERLLLRRLTENPDAGRAVLLSKSVLAPSLNIGDDISYARWGSFNVCLFVVRGERLDDIEIEPQGRGAQIGVFFADKSGDSDLIGANLTCSNPSCGALFGITFSDFQKAVASAASHAGSIGAESSTLALTCSVCSTARAIDSRSFDGLYRL